jgi:uncharacterized protein YbaR (Trm112 family)
MQRTGRTKRAALMPRVFARDVLACPRCSGRLRVRKSPGLAGPGRPQRRWRRSFLRAPMNMLGCRSQTEGSGSDAVP